MKHDPDDVRGYLETIDARERADAEAEKREAAERELGKRVLDVLRYAAPVMDGEDSGARAVRSGYLLGIRDAAIILGLLPEGRS